MSKAALNQATQTMALELKWSCVWCVVLHTGMTDTNLSKPFHTNVKPSKLFPMEYTIKQLLAIMDVLMEEQLGGFYDYAGQAISFQKLRRNNSKGVKKWTTHQKQFKFL